MVLPGWATSQCLVRVCPVLGVSRGIVVDAVDVLCGSFNGAGAFTPRCCEGYTPPSPGQPPLSSQPRTDCHCGTKGGANSEGYNSCLRTSQGQVTAGFQVRLLPCLAFLPVLSCFPPSCFSESTHSVNHLSPRFLLQVLFLGNSTSGNWYWVWS